MTGQRGEHDHAVMQRRAIGLAMVTAAWELTEAILAFTAGILANSIALTGLSVASGIGAATVVFWQLFDVGLPDDWLTLRLITISFLVLAASVIVQAVGALLRRQQAEPSPLGIGLNVAVIRVMVPVAVLQH